MPLGAGSLIKGTIKLERELGRGAMGTVWVAHHQNLHSQVAVKVLLGEGRTDPHRRLRFEQEARGVAQIDSPHVVRIFDYGFSDEGEPFIVMELLRGSDLGVYLETRGRLPLAQTATLVRQLCTALTRAHELGIVHRDIKPQNVFLQDVDGEPFVKVLDFGVAKHTHDDRNMTASGALVGTPYYMGPEQLVGAKDIDHRADLWSVAVVAYVCLTGQPPFHGETVGALTMAVHKGHFVMPTQLDSGLPPQLDGWFQRALMVDPTARYQSARELSQAFDAAAAQSDAASNLHASWAHASTIHSGAAQQHHAPPQPQQQPQQQQATWPTPQHPVVPTPPGVQLPHPAHSAMTAGTADGLAASAPAAANNERRSRAPLFIGALLGVLGLSALVIAFVVPQLRQSTSESERSDKKKPKKRKKTKTAKTTTEETSASDDTAPAAPKATPRSRAPRSTAPATKPSPKKPAPKRVASAGLEGTLRSCWNQVNQGSFNGKPSSATVTVTFSTHPRPTSVRVSGPASNIGGYISCVANVGFSKSYSQATHDAGTAVSSAQLPACVLDTNGLVNCSGN